MTAWLIGFGVQEFLGFHSESTSLYKYHEYEVVTKLCEFSAINEGACSSVEPSKAWLCEPSTGLVGHGTPLCYLENALKDPQFHQMVSRLKFQVPNLFLLYILYQPRRKPNWPLASPGSGSEACGRVEDTESTKAITWQRCFSHVSGGFFQEVWHPVQQIHEVSQRIKLDMPWISFISCSWYVVSALGLVDSSSPVRLAEAAKADITSPGLCCRFLRDYSQVACMLKVIFLLPSGTTGPRSSVYWQLALKLELGFWLEFRLPETWNVGFPNIRSGILLNFLDEMP